MLVSIAVVCLPLTNLYLQGRDTVVRMSLQRRHNVRVAGEGPATLFFAHGFGCDQNMWRLIEPSYAKRYRTVLFDHVGYEPEAHKLLLRRRSCRAISRSRSATLIQSG